MHKNENSVSDKAALASILTKGFLLLFMVSICEQMSFISVRTVVTPYAKNELFMAASLLGMLSGMLSVASLFSRFVAGSFMARLSHKKLLLISLGIEVLILGSYILVTEFALLIVVRLLHGFFYGIVNTAITTMAGNSLRSEYMGRGMGLFGISNMISLGIAPTLSMAIYNAAGSTTIFVFSCLCTLGALLFTLLTPEPSRTPAAAKGPRPARGGIFLPSALLPSALNFFMQVAYASVATFIIVYGEEKGWAQAGLFYTVYALGSLAVRPLMGKLYDKKGLKPPVFLTYIVFTIGMVTLATAGSFPVFLLSGMLLTIGFGGGWCVFQAAALNCENPADRSRASATYFIINDSGAFLGSILAGYICGALGYSGTFLVFIVPLAAGLLIYTALLVSRRVR